MYLLLLFALLALVGLFAVENEGTLAFHLLGYSWILPTWVPAAIGVGAVSVLLVLAATSARLGTRLRKIGHDREINTHRAVIESMNVEIARLREELAAAAAEARALRAAAAAPAVAPAAAPPPSDS